MFYLIITLSVYFVSVLLVGILRFRHQTPKEYITAPSSTGFLALTASLLGTIVGGGMFLGVAQLGFEKGITVFALGISYFVGSIILGLLAPHFRNYAKDNNITTLFGVFEKLYPSKGRIGLAVIFAWMTFLVFFLMLAVQFVGIATFLSFYIRINFHLTIMIGAVILAGISIPIYTAIGGFKRDIYTDIIQVLFVCLGLGIVLYGMMSNEVADKLSRLPNELTTFQSDDTIFFVGVLFLVAPTFLVRFDLWQRMITAKSNRHVRAAFFVSGILSFLFFVAFGIIGMYANAEGVRDARFAGLEVIQMVVKGPLGAVVVAAFFAAVMSSADTFLGVSALAVARSTIYRKGELEDPDKKNVSVRRLRFFTFFVGVASMGLAYAFLDIIDLFASAFGILMVFLPPFVGGLVRKKPGTKEAWWSVCAGLAVFLPLVIFIPKEAFLVGFTVSLIAYLVSASVHKEA